jgi:opacity protein-like surface antigen
MFRRFGFLLAAALLAAVPAAAQDEKPVQLTIGGGFTTIMGPAKDHFGSAGGNFTLGVLFNVSPTIGVQGEYGWNGVPKKQLVFDVCATNPCVTPLVPTDFFADGNMQYGAGNVLFHPSTDSKAKPYVLAGLGVYYRPVNITTPGVGYTTICDPYWYVCYPTLVAVDQVVGSRSTTDFGMNFGGGLNYKLTDAASIYFEVRYHYIWGPKFGPQVNPLTGAQIAETKANGQFLPITVGFRF